MFVFLYCLIDIDHRIGDSINNNNNRLNTKKKTLKELNKEEENFLPIFDDNC